MADNESHNVVDLAEARKKGRSILTLGRGNRNQTKGGTAKNPSGSKTRVGFWQIVQVLVFLALVAYLMKLCGGR